MRLRDPFQLTLRIMDDDVSRSESMAMSHDPLFLNYQTAQHQMRILRATPPSQALLGVTLLLPEE